jgi:ABC-type multidrug transport system permease subunit
MFLVAIFSLAMASTALAVALGCAVEDPKLGQEMLPLLFVPQMLFAGFFVTPEFIPVWLRWARYLCTLTYSVRILLVEEFQDCADAEAESGAQPAYCSSILTNVEADKDETWWNWLILVSLFAFFRLLALFILQRKATKFY